MLLVVNKNYSTPNTFNDQYKPTLVLKSPYRYETDHLVSGLIRSGHRVTNKAPHSEVLQCPGQKDTLVCQEIFRITPCCHVVTRDLDTSKDLGVRALTTTSQICGRACGLEGAVVPETPCSVLSPYSLTQSTCLLWKAEGCNLKKVSLEAHASLLWGLAV